MSLSLLLCLTSDTDLNVLCDCDRQDPDTGSSDPVWAGVSCVVCGKRFYTVPCRNVVLDLSNKPPPHKNWRSTNLNILLHLPPSGWELLSIQTWTINVLISLDIMADEMLLLLSVSTSFNKSKLDSWNSRAFSSTVGRYCQRLGQLNNHRQGDRLSASMTTQHDGEARGRWSNSEKQMVLYSDQSGT